MALSSPTLASGLTALLPTTSESDAIGRIVDAWEAYFDQSQLGLVTAVHGSYAAALSAMRSAMAGLSAANAGATKIQAGLIAFWTTVAPLAATVWPQTPPPVTTPPATPPPTLSGVAAALQAQWTVDIAAQASLSTGASNTAAILHTNAGLGGICVITTPPATAVPTPIL